MLRIALGIVALAINASLALHVVVRAPTTRFCHAFALHALAAALWCSGGVLFHLGRGTSAAILVAMAGALLVPAAFLTQAAAYRRGPLRRRHGFAADLLLLAPFLIMAYALPRLGLAQGAASHYWRSEPPGVAAAALLTLYLLGMLGAGVWLLVTSRKALGGGPEVAELSAVLAINVLLPLAALGLMLFAGGSRGGRVPSEMLMLVLCAELNLLALVRWRRVSLRGLLDRALLFGAAAGGVAIVTALTAWSLDHVLDLQLGLPAVALATIVALFASFGFLAVRPHLERFAARVLSNERVALRARAEQLRLELERTRSRLEQAEHLALLGNLAAAVAHEIKNPLGPIRGYAEILREELDKVELDARARAMVSKCLRIIEEEVTRIDEKVSRLLLRAREPAPRPRLLDVNALAESVAALARGAPQGRAGAVETELTAGLPPVWADEERLRGALYNLLKNALEASGPGGAAGIRTATCADEGRPAVRITVWDLGPGIAVDVSAHLFAEYVTTKDGGTGLGLALARQAVESDNGRLEVESRPGEGTAFHVILVAGGKA
ncbi:MAG: hypothetical protein HYV63_06880 [Candidatus Schekmanbacteria bacterium]|nr:hypothetical protein [Candidatus Schekmanbacteria bacterium]